MQWKRKAKRQLIAMEEKSKEAVDCNGREKQRVWQLTVMEEKSKESGFTL